jgi:hypothetical protein
VLVVVARMIFFCFGAAIPAKTFAVPNAKSNAAIINVIITLLFLNIFMIILLYIKFLFYCETPILKAKRIGIGKLNNPASSGGNESQSLLWGSFP